MSAQLPTILALLGTVLLALAIFAPPRAAGGPAVSFAPPVAAGPVERTVPAEPWRPPGEPSWPALVDPRAAGCDAAARLALVEALLAVRAPWAEAILQRAAAQERDPSVIAALAGPTAKERLNLPRV